jgi:hypothetical protein
MAKRTTGLFDYANRNTASARYRTSGGTSSIPVAGRTGATIDPSPLKSKTAPKGGSGGLESRQIPAAIQEAGPEAMSVEGGEASMQPQMVTETQQPIENRGGSARYMIQGGGPRIDLSFLVPERANKEFDPSKAIGGENLPFQESKGVGGFFRRMLGDESNQQNIAAQQAQGAEWRQEAKEQKAEERLLNRMREGDKPTQARFEATQASGRESEANRVAAENKRLELEGKRVGLTERQIEEARLDRIDRMKGEQEDRAARIENMRTQNALADYTVGQNQLKANQPTMTSLSGGGMGVFDPNTKAISIVNPGTQGFGDKFPGTAPTTRQVYPPPQFKSSGSGSDQVDRGTGLLPGGGALTTPTRFGEVSIGSEELPPGGLTEPVGVGMGGKLPPQPQNTALVPRFMRGAGDVMGGVMTSATDPLRYAGKEMYRQLLSSGAQQDPEVLKRLKKREEESSPWDIQ